MPNNFPENGFLYKNQVLFYDKKINSDKKFIILNQEIHYFRSVQNHIIANQIIANNTFNDRPYHYLPEQGGSNIMRGLRTGRYIDNHFLGAQTEYRSPYIFWRVSGVCFVASGLSYKGINDFHSKNINLTGGFGVRFALDKSERINLRGDIGYSKEGYQIYLKFGEAF
jgi:hypothetical protein